MKQHKFVWIVIFISMAICFVCILVKSFIAVHVYPEVTACVNLMFKLNPLGENVVYGKYEALELDMQSALLIYTDEMKLIGEDFIRCVSKVSLSIYILIFVSLLGVYIKRDKIKLMKPSTLLYYLLCWQYLFSLYGCFKPMTFPTNFTAPINNTHTR